MRKPFIIVSADNGNAIYNLAPIDQVRVTLARILTHSPTLTLTPTPTSIPRPHLAPVVQADPSNWAYTKQQLSFIGADVGGLAVGGTHLRPDSNPAAVCTHGRFARHHPTDRGPDFRSNRVLHPSLAADSPAAVASPPRPDTDGDGFAELYVPAYDLGVVSKFDFVSIAA
eukprot:6142524-Prymnesium_polylepis.2